MQKLELETFSKDPFSHIYNHLITRYGNKSVTERKL